MKTENDERWLVCRVCLQEDSNLQKIFSVNSAENLMDMLHECGGVPICIDDHYPNKICNKCLCSLRIAHKFRKICQQSHDQISQMLAAETTMLDEALIHDGGEMMDQVVQIVDEVNGAHDDEPIKIESLEEADEQESITEFSYYEEQPTEGEEIVEADYTEFSECEVVEAHYDPEETVIIDDDIGQDVLSSDDDYVPSIVKRSNKRQQKFLNSINPTAKQEEEQIDGKKLGRKPKDKPHTYICDVCGNIYRTQARLTEHMKFHSGIKPHECEICGRGFVQNQQLARHMNTHTGNRPYKCNYCPAAFADRSTKTKHHRIHTKERPYECDVCGKTFTYSDNLKFHKMIHTGEKPHACDICGKGFTKAYKMRLHRTTHEKRGLIPSGTSIVKNEVITG